ncbi:acyl-CoA dehydrogenase C-terminal domain-containing protein [Roseomonas gilardii subsp. gilardii]|uniref:acyl-CoA dehydrogenase C-terminal domain-containing protein n=1 Tax=Roseomonas gilardii TaxID=257708 RepID=UPI001FF7B6C9|nr:acyl-CoA dehydrogenase C-terminal domain-containing protein [Roseomonas gilardii]UPG73160.1 acyl-CoA dehydrogenase C-terminal domain-containing protein [Roseomonas gilardii subsp. gilardii]
MPSYKAPLRDMRFLLSEIMAMDRLRALPGCEEMQPDLIDPVLEEAAKLCEEVLFPINRPGDEEGCHYENGVVRTPKGFREAYDAFRAGGWTAMACDPAYGGQGLPRTVSLLFEEMICSANLAFSLYPGLSHGAYTALHTHGTAEMKALYLPKLVSGEWSGTMCLTEPHCGTDLGLIRTRALPAEDGTYRLSGTKIFISAGEHDLTENIVHFVLAKLPDAPPGVKGISMFLVPKFLPDENGRAGPRNGVSCASIEHKMGIKASATCVMNFDGAKAWLLGTPHKGLRTMFTMMNEERLSVGIQGLGIAEVSYQNAVAYARERLQGRALGGAKYPDKPADPILVHPDVRRMLLTMRAYAEGCRALGVAVAFQHDIATRHPEPEERLAAEDYVALMTPVVKALFTDLGTLCANHGMQVMGGHGYIREWGMEQYARDARIAQIYEGTNGIQALDLAGRKMPAHAGRYLRRFFHPVLGFIERHEEDERMGEFILPLSKAFGRLQQCTAELARRGLSDPTEIGAGATDYLRLFGLTALAHQWALMAEAALRGDGGETPEFYAAKLATARFFMQRLLPETGALASAILAGGASMMAFDDAAF